MRGIWSTLTSPTAVRIVVVVLVVVTIVVVALLSARTTEGPVSTPSSATPAPPRPQPTTPQVTTSSPSEPQAEPSWAPQDPDQAAVVAEAFVGAWAAGPSTDAEQWYTKVEPYLAPVVQRGFADVDPSLVPASQVTGPAVVVAAGGSQAEVDVPTDAGPQRVTLARAAQDDPWLVVAIGPAP